MAGRHFFGHQSLDLGQHLLLYLAPGLWLALSLAWGWSGGPAQKTWRRLGSAALFLLVSGALVLLVAVLRPVERLSAWARAGYYESRVAAETLTWRWLEAPDFDGPVGLELGFDLRFPGRLSTRSTPQLLFGEFALPEYLQTLPFFRHRETGREAGVLVAGGFNDKGYPRGVSGPLESGRQHLVFHPAAIARWLPGEVCLLESTGDVVPERAGELLLDWRLRSESMPFPDLPRQRLETLLRAGLPRDPTWNATWDGVLARFTPTGLSAAGYLPCLDEERRYRRRCFCRA